MGTRTKLIPASSQTVGPFFRIGLDYLMDCTLSDDAHAGGMIAIQGKVLDRDGAPVPDALLEFWSGEQRAYSNDAGSTGSGISDGFRRAATDGNGAFKVVMKKPDLDRLGDGRFQAPHMLVLVFARGLLRHLISRVYFEGEPGNANDPVLLEIPAERRHTLIARRDEASAYCWDVKLQGADETVFFAW
jgi:protocatechuate 3,4-dioxygenase alpha subunit